MDSQTTTRAAADEGSHPCHPSANDRRLERGRCRSLRRAIHRRGEFVAFKGTHLKGRREIASFHRRIFDTVVKGTRLQGEVKFVRLLNAVVGVMHSVVRVTLPGQTEPSPSRDSMQLTVVAKRDGEWRSEGLMNARRLTMERQLFLDDIDSLPAEAQRQVTDLLASLKKSRL